MRKDMVKKSHSKNKTTQTRRHASPKHRPRPAMPKPPRPPVPAMPPPQPAQPVPEPVHAAEVLIAGSDSVRVTQGGSVLRPDPFGRLP